ncbi:MAG: acetyltransferase [Fusobacteriaceae bacterium]
MKKVIIIGAGGHAKVVIDIILQRQKRLNDNVEIIGILDDSFSETEKKRLFGILIIGKLDKILELSKDIFYVIAIGSNKIRKKIAERYSSINYITTIHPNSIIAEEVEIDLGTVVMAGTIVNSYTKIGKHCIINTGSIIEHDNVLSDYVHISPNATLCGGIKIGEETWVGAGATVIQGVEISKNVIVGAGSVVVGSIEDNSIYVGIPAKNKELKRN